MDKGSNDTILLVSCVRKNPNKSSASEPSQTLTAEQEDLGRNYESDQRSHAGHMTN